ncbi:MAG: J domain-containing protein [Nitrospiraceae bacterium]|nr:J domain-containing protein [Nitrospiraceae bacterium]
MGKICSGTHLGEGREFQSLLAASLMRRFEAIPEEEVYEKASRCFDLLLDVRECPDTAARISFLIGRPAALVQRSAEAIIDLVLFNRNNDPYASLGLPRYAGKAEVNRRWKRLIVLYHPDKYPNQREHYEEKAKKINEAYGEIRKEAGMHTSPDTVFYPSGKSPSRTEAAPYRRYLKHVPTVILALVIFIAVVSVLFFINAVKDTGHY